MHSNGIDLPINEAVQRSPSNYSRTMLTKSLQYISVYILSVVALHRLIDVNIGAETQGSECLVLVTTVLVSG